jgi:hypothetical protein
MEPDTGSGSGDFEMRICFHDWYKWSELVPTYGNSKMQFRDCSKCGKTQKRSLGYCDGVMAEAANKAIRLIHELGNAKP